jgi:hypothetical protein
MNPPPHLAGLGELKLATPCSVSWDSMKGDARARFCEQCGLNVYDVQNLTAAEVKEILEKKEGKVCGLLFFRADGTLITKDCPKGLAAIAARFEDEKKRASLHYRSRFGILAAAIASVVFALLITFKDEIRHALEPTPDPLAEPTPVPEQRPRMRYMGSFGQNNTY